MRNLPKSKKDRANNELSIVKYKIKNILSEYNMSLISQDEWHGVLIVDNDTDLTIGI